MNRFATGVPQGSPRGGTTIPGATAFTAVQDAFLQRLAETGNPSAACRASGLNRRQVNAMRQRDMDFAHAYDEALDDAADLLEAEAWRRAIEGVPQLLLKAGQPVLGADGEAIMVRRYSDPLLVMLLRGCKPAKFQRPTAASATSADPNAVIREIAADHDPPRTELRQS